MLTKLDQLQKAILEMHGCSSVPTATIAVNETFEGKHVWTGDVEELLLVDHPLAQRAYAWSYKNDEGRTCYVAILGLPPIQTAIDAVRTYVTAQRQTKR